ncbi:MAG: DUF4097 family beta strand repeat-containing protein [Bryobacteraceae bacterium]
MTRRSVVGPFILIVLGLLFLLNNVKPDLKIFSEMARYWPFLLIAWGALRLVEVLVLAVSGRPLPSRGLSGGEIFLIILICLFGSTLYSLDRWLPRVRLGPRSMEIFGESYDYPISVQKALPAHARITLDNQRGNVRITGGDLPEIKISGRKTVLAYNKTDADQTNEQSPIEVSVEGANVVIRTNQERVPESRRISAELEITVPRSAALVARTRSGDYDIDQLDGGVEIASDRSEVRLSKIGGNVRVDTRSSGIIRAVDVKGEVMLTGRGNNIELENITGAVNVNGSYSGNLEFKNFAKAFHFESRNTDLKVVRVPGRISMDLGSFSALNVVGPIRMTSKSKDVKFEEFTDSLELDLERGDLELRPVKGPLGRIDAKIRNSGNIDLTVPAAAKFDLTGSTDRGEIRNEFGDVLAVETFGRSAKIRGKVGQGPLITLSTARGTVTTRKE